MMCADDLRIRRLSTHEVRDVYRKYLKNDFPRNERRPLGNIMSMRRRGQYVCCGAFGENGLAGYAFLIVLALGGKQCCLLDYFAVLLALRGRHIGSGFLSRLRRSMQTADLLLVEVEDPDREDDPEKRAVQERRLSFYLKNGLRDTSVRVETFGVPYRILEVPLSRKKAEAAEAPVSREKAAAAEVLLSRGGTDAAAAQREIRSAYKAFYRTRLTERAFDRYIHFV